jgi:hypothetical protein
MSVATIPRFRMWPMMVSMSGWSSGSPPLMVMIDVPRSAR